MAIAMDGVKWLVVGGGLAAIGGVNWYFFLPGRAGARAVVTDTDPSADARVGARSGTAEVEITVHGGYIPSVVRVRAGSPVRLVFDRQETGSCSEEVVFPDFGVRKYLPAGERTPIEVTPPTPGRYEFMCGMSMLRGVLIAEG
ncbi:MAG: cupredoxin domain-containing protein [Gemmatimonadaceae bacterium]